MGVDSSFFLEILEWFDPSGREIAARLPEQGSGEIKYGAQCIVRESQIGIFFYKGRAIHVFGPGRHTLKTGNIPLLTKLISLPWGLKSPLRAEMYFINTKVFTGQKWGTRDPVAFRDSELGLIRLRAFGQFDFRVVQPLLFINSLVGTVSSFSSEDIDDYLGKVIVSRLNDYLGENLNSIFDLPGQYDEWSTGLRKRLQHDFSRFGLALPQLYINSITPPPEVQQAIDDRSRMEVFDDLNKLMRFKSAMAVEEAASSEGGSGQGMGMGLGLMMPSMMAEYMQSAKSEAKASSGTNAQSPQLNCPDCGQLVSSEARFCPFCGHQLVVFQQCVSCGKNLPPGAKFCSRCGCPVQDKAKDKLCANCGCKNLPKAVFCNECGQKLDS